MLFAVLTMALFNPYDAIPGANFFEPFCATSILPKTRKEDISKIIIAVVFYFNVK